MKSLVIFFWFGIVWSVNSKELDPNQKSLMIPRTSELDSEKSFAVTAIHKLIVQYFSKNCREVDLVTVGMAGGSAETMSNELIGVMPKNISVRLMNQETAGEIKTSTILLFDSKQRSKKFEFVEKFVSRRGAWHKHLIYAPGLQLQDVMRKFSSNPTISEVNFLVDYDGDSFVLATSFMFTAESCQPNQIKTINRFTRATHRWESSNFYPDKYKNFHGCTIEVHYDKFTKTFGELVFEGMSRSLNFKVARIYHKDFDFFLVKNYSHVMIDKFGTPADSTKDLVMSSALYFEHLVFVAPPGEPLTDLERMFAAFDGPTWIAIGATFAIALFAIQLIKLMPRKVQDFVFGRNIRTPTLNVFSIFLIGMQHRLPWRNFARYLVIMFAVWSMIFRTCYQSMMFEHLNSDLRYPRIKTIDELNENNFTLVRASVYTPLLKRYEFNYDKSLLENDTKWFDSVPEPANKLYYIMYRGYYLQGLMESHGRKFLPSTYVLDENLATVPIYMALPPFVPFTQAIREKVDEMLSGGLIQKIYTEAYGFRLDKQEVKHFVAKVEPQVLTIENLRFGFMAYLFLLALSFVVFLVELLIKPVKMSVKAVEVWIITCIASCLTKALNCLEKKIPKV